MLKYRVFNILDAWEKGEVHIILQGCNCFCAFGKGLALEIKNRYPEAYEADKQTTYASKDKLGDFSFIQPQENFFLINAYTQYHWIKNLNNESETIKNGKPVFVLADYHAIRKVMIAIRNQFSNGLTLGIPKIGAGLANGDWNIIESIIKEELIDYGYDVIFYVIDEKEIPSNRIVILDSF